MLSCTGTLATTLGLDQPFRYRGYVYDTETGWYYLQSRYYDPSIGRFISADVLLSTGQGVLGHNSFAYCLGNPVNMADEGGCIPVQVDSTPEDNDLIGELKRLAQQYTTVKTYYIGIDFEPWADFLYYAIDILGMDTVTNIMADVACYEYQKTMCHRFPLTNSCVAYEIEYHIDGYFFAIGKNNYFFKRNITTWLFPKEKLIKHCSSADIYFLDIYDPYSQIGCYESIFFGYRNSIRTNSFMVSLGYRPGFRDCYK